MEREESRDRKEGDSLEEKLSAIACPMEAYTYCHQ